VPSESDLRDLLRGPEPEGRAAIDLNAVLTRARRRRRPKVVVAQALGSVAAVGVLGTAIFVAIPRADQTSSMIAQDTAAGGSAVESAPFADSDAAKWVPETCGAQVVDHPGSAVLGAEITLPTTIEPGATVPVTVTLRNDGPDVVTGTTPVAPYLVFSEAGTVLWHSYAEQDFSGRLVDLAPGESITYDAVFERTVCASEDELMAPEPANPLPLAGPGSYEVRATIVLQSVDGPTFVASSPALTVAIPE
jgi:hypothetical protein